MIPLLLLLVSSPLAFKSSSSKIWGTFFPSIYNYYYYRYNIILLLLFNHAPINWISWVQLKSKLICLLVYVVFFFRKSKDYVFGPFMSLVQEIILTFCFAFRSFRLSAEAKPRLGNERGSKSRFYCKQHWYNNFSKLNCVNVFTV